MIFTKYPNDFWHKRKIDNFDPYNVLLAIATNIPVLLMTGFVVQGHIWIIILTYGVILVTVFSYKPRGFSLARWVSSYRRFQIDQVLSQLQMKRVLVSPSLCHWLCLQHHSFSETSWFLQKSSHCCLQTFPKWMYIQMWVTLYVL